METLLQDLRYSLRVIAKSPSFTIVAIIALALGIGANTAIFSVVDSVLLRALPYRDAGKLVWATNFVPRQGQNLVFADEYSGWRNQNHVFEDIAAYSASAEYTLTGAGAPQRLRGARVTAEFPERAGRHAATGAQFSAGGGPPCRTKDRAVERSSVEIELWRRSQRDWKSDRV